MADLVWEVGIQNLLAEALKEAWDLPTAVQQGSPRFHWEYLRALVDVHAPHAPLVRAPSPHRNSPPCAVPARAWLWE